jgi:hypothetical protein
MGVLGEYDAWIKFGSKPYKHTLVVLESLKYDAVFGVDFFTAVGAILDFCTHRMTLPDCITDLHVWKDSVTVSDLHSSLVGAITIAKSVTIPPVVIYIRLLAYSVTTIRVSGISCGYWVSYTTRAIP